MHIWLLTFYLTSLGTPNLKLLLIDIILHLRPKKIHLIRKNILWCDIQQIIGF